MSSSPPTTGPLYLDNNATTRVLPEVWEAMCPYLADDFGNPRRACFGFSEGGVVESKR